jgi:hypothetical protein
VPALILGLAFFLALAPAAAAGQSCGPRTGAWTGLEAGRVGYDVAGGITGYEWGADMGVDGISVAWHVGYRRVELDDSDVTPQLLRASLRYALPREDRWRVCLAAHGGASRFSGESGEGTVLAGGGGLAVSRALLIGDVLVAPFLEARGLAARSTGTALDVDTDAGGMSLGVAGGAVAHVGRANISASGSRDGFAGGLGVTPYPAWALRLGVGYRF